MTYMISCQTDICQPQNATHEEIDSEDIFNALERIAIGLEKKDAVMSEQKKKLVAYHEAGHAILGALMCPGRTKSIENSEVHNI